MRGMLIAALLLLMTGTGWAAPTGVEVTLYPSGGRVQVATRMPIQDGKITFELPAGAQTDSLVLSVEGATLVRWESVLVAGTDGAGVAELRRDLLQAKQHQASLEGEMTAIRSRIALWSAVGVKDADVSELEKRDAAMTARLVPLHVQLATLDPQYQEASLQVKRLEQALQRKGETGDSTRITAWLGKMEETPSESDAAVVYAYSLTGCGWNPVYRLNAMPEQGQVRFAQEAEIWQGTGQDWKHVQLTLASGSLESRLSPMPLRDWLIREERPIPRQAASAERKQMPLMMMSNADMMASPAQGIEREDQATLTTWALGERDIPAGTSIRLGLESGEWKASFVRLVRPSQPSPQKAAYLCAEVENPLMLAFTSGSAEYFVDGMPVGTGVFPQPDSEGTLYFGLDPLVSADMKLDRRQSGSKGFVDKRKTQVWVWTIEVSNRHDQPVKVRVEDPEPQAASEEIQIKTMANPMPELRDHTRFWTLSIPARGKSSIPYTVEVSAPKDIIEGR